LSFTFLRVASTSEQWANSPAREPQAISAAPALEIVSDIAQTMSEKKRRLFVTPAAPGCSFISFAAIEAVPFLAEKNDRVQIFAGLIRQFVTIWKNADESFDERRVVTTDRPENGLVRLVRHSQDFRPSGHQDDGLRDPLQFELSDRSHSSFSVLKPSAREGLRHRPAPGCGSLGFPDWNEQAAEYYGKAAPTATVRLAAIVHKSVLNDRSTSWPYALHLPAFRLKWIGILAPFMKHESKRPATS
jgi:hypothetical protein